MTTSRAEPVGGVSHTQCFTCGAFCRSHAHHLLHLASSHPALLDNAPAGRLGLVFLYQASGKLFHCNICLYTSRDFTQVWQHVLRNHCVDQEQTKDQNPGSKLSQDQAKDQGPETKPGLNPDPETKPETRGTETKVRPGLEPEPGAGPGAGSGDVEMKSDGGEERGNKGGEKEQEPVEAMETEDHEDQSLQKSSGAPDGSPPSPAPDTKCGLLLRSGSGPYRCSVCPWSHKLRAIAVNHAVRKHDSPRHLYDVPQPEPAPAETNPAPSESNPAPAETTPAPSDTKLAPAESNPAPSESNPAPAETAPAPTDTKLAPAESNPAESNPAPVESNPAPAETTPTPADTKLAPAESNPAPAESNPAPAESKPAPVDSNPAPAESNPAPAESNSAPAEEEEEGTADTMRQELEATKILRFSGHHVICELCGWKAKVRRGTRAGFAQSHLERCHDLKKSFECTICGQAFFMAYRLRDHMRISHRPGKYRCLFCSFRSDNLTGFRRHSGKCNFKDQDEDQDQDPDQVRTKPEPEEEHERILRPKRRSSRLILDEDED